MLQAAFGWLDDHLHAFIIGGLAYGAPELARQAIADDDPQMFEATDVHLRDFDVYHVPESTALDTGPRKMSAAPPATPNFSKPGTTPTTTSTRPCAAGQAGPSIPRSSISKPPTRP
jgi:hypothetical protein